MKKQQNSAFGKKSLLIILFLFIVTIIAILVSVWALFFREIDVILAPDYAPQETEPNAERLPNDSADKLDAPEGGGAVSLTYSNQVRIDLSAEEAYLLFANPGKSTQDIVLQIVIQDEVIIQSGLLTPGHQIKTLDLLSGMAQKLTIGGYNGKFIVLYYDRESGEKAVVNTEIPIHITVKE